MKERFTNVAQKTLDVFVKFASTKAITALKDGFVLSMRSRSSARSSC